MHCFVAKIQDTIFHLTTDKQSVFPTITRTFLALNLKGLFWQSMQTAINMYAEKWKTISSVRFSTDRSHCSKNS